MCGKKISNYSQPSLEADLQHSLNERACTCKETTDARRSRTLEWTDTKSNDVCDAKVDDEEAVDDADVDLSAGFTHCVISEPYLKN